MKKIKKKLKLNKKSIYRLNDDEIKKIKGGGTIGLHCGHSEFCKLETDQPAQGIYC